MLKVDTHYKSHLVPYYIPLIYPSFRINARENFFLRNQGRRLNMIWKISSCWLGLYFWEDRGETT